MIALLQLVLLSCIMASHKIGLEHRSLLVLHKCAYFPRDEMVSERLQTAELQDKLSSSVQEKLTAEGERERLELEIQRLKVQLKWQQEQLSSTKEALISSQKPELHTAHIESRLSPVERTKDESVDQVAGFHVH